MHQPKFDISTDYARQLDLQDPLAAYRQRFLCVDPELLYMDGNSLGRLSVESLEAAQEVVKDQWGSGLIRSWGTNWFDAPRRVGEKIACLCGAAPGQVLVSDSTSVNLFKLVMAALEYRPGRKKIISDDMNFPSDLYILQGIIRLLNRGHELHIIPSQDSISMDLEAIFHSIDDDTALVTLSQVTFKSGFLYDVEQITRRAHKKGALVLWDLSHSIAAVPIHLDQWEVDMAIGCTYKYLNGGPGSPAFLYIRRDLQDSLQSPIWGWFGDKRPFAFDLHYIPAPGIQHFLCGSPPVLSLLSMEAALQPILEAGIPAIREKSIVLTNYAVELFDEMLSPLGFSLGSPRQAAMRGSHISIRHAEGYRINRALIEEMKVIPDFREPDNIRLGLSPLYTSFSDVRETFSRIQQVMVQKRYLHFDQERLAVT
jgi:kynureninase